MLLPRQKRAQSAFHFSAAMAAKLARTMTQKAEIVEERAAACKKLQSSTETVTTAQLPLQKMQQTFQSKLRFIQDHKVFSSNHNYAVTKPLENRGYSKRFFQYIEDVTHMDEVRKAQAEVMTIKNQLRNAGNQKRAILKQLDLTRNDLTQIYKEMKFTSNRASGHYLELVKMEVDLYLKEQNLQEEFIAADEQEQHLFNAFSAAINDSYEKEKMHTSFIKVLGILGTIFGTFLTMIVSVVGQINHANKFYILREDVEKVLAAQFTTKIDEFNNRLIPLERQQSPIESESWGSYLKRHTRWMYGWALPKN